MKKLVYIVEDDVDILTMLATLLLNNGFEIHADWNGNELDNKASQPPRPDIYLMDINLFGKSGLDLCKRTKQRYPTVPVMLISANDSLAEKAGAAGADGFLEKPFNLKQLVAEINILTSKAMN